MSEREKQEVVGSEAYPDEGREREPSVSVHSYLPISLYRKLKREASRQVTSTSAIIREALEQYLKEREGQE
jgi:predicted DNA-binding protein